MNLGPGVKVWILKKINKTNMQKIPEKVWISLFTIACMATHINICTLVMLQEIIYMHSFWKKMPDSDTELGHFSTFIFYTVQSAGY